MNIYEAFERCGYLPAVPLPEDMDTDVIPEYVIAVYEHTISRGTNRENMNNYPESVRQLQMYLGRAHYYNGDVDSYIDDGFSTTIEALQKYLRDYRYYKGIVDGKLDDTSSDTIKALQEWLSFHILYDGTIDGFIDAQNSGTMKALKMLSER